MLFISFLLFFIMTGITDAVDALIYNAIGVRWQLFTFLPLWFMFMVAYTIAGYFVTEDCLKEFRSGQWVAGALAMVGCYSYDFNIFKGINNFHGDCSCIDLD